MTCTKAPALFLGLFSITFLASCGKAARVTPTGIATGIAAEVIYDGLKSAAEESRAQRAAWKAGVSHPENSNLRSTEKFGFWRPVNGACWKDTGTTEPRRVR